MVGHHDLGTNAMAAVQPSFAERPHREAGHSSRPPQTNQSSTSAPGTMMAPAVAIVGGNTLATQYNPPRDAFKGSGNGGKGCNESITPALKAMEAEFGRDQLLLLGGLPIVATESSVLAMAAQHGVTAQSAAMQVSNDGARSCRLMLAKACQLSHSIECLNGRSWHGCTLSAGVPPPDAMLFVGNLGKRRCGTTVSRSSLPGCSLPVPKGHARLSSFFLIKTLPTWLQLLPLTTSCCVNCLWSLGLFTGPLSSAAEPLRRARGMGLSSLPVRAKQRWPRQRSRPRLLKIDRSAWTG